MQPAFYDGHIFLALLSMILTFGAQGPAKSLSSKLMLVTIFTQKLKNNNCICSVQAHCELQMHIKQFMLSTYWSVSPLACTVSTCGVVTYNSQNCKQKRVQSVNKQKVTAKFKRNTSPDYFVSPIAIF